MKIEFHSNNNGYVVNIEGSIRRNGEYSFKNTEELLMLEFIGEVLLDKKIKIDYR